MKNSDADAANMLVRKGINELDDILGGGLSASSLSFAWVSRFR
jgi:hypothetical protein